MSIKNYFLSLLVFGVSALASSGAQALDGVDFTGSPTWGITTNGSAKYVCVENAFDGLSAIVWYNLGGSQTIEKWGEATGDRQAGFVGYQTYFTIWHPYSESSVSFNFQLSNIACADIGNLPEAAQQKPGREFGFTTVGDPEGISFFSYSFNCSDTYASFSLDVFGYPNSPEEKPNGSVSFAIEDRRPGDCLDEIGGSFPGLNLDHYRKRAAEMEEVSALPNTL